jgi:hypothetical protein
VKVTSVCSVVLWPLGWSDPGSHDDRPPNRMRSWDACAAPAPLDARYSDESARLTKRCAECRKAWIAVVPTPGNVAMRTLRRVAGLRTGARRLVSRIAFAWSG